MKKTMKKILCSLLVVVMCLTAAPLQGFVDFDWGWLDFSVKASALSSSGVCGENVTYTYNSSTGEVVISGTGPMYDYWGDNKSPFYCSAWYYNYNIQTIVIEHGVTSIGANIFAGSEKLTSVTIPNTVKSIGNSAFYGCEKLKDLIIPEGVEYIGSDAFRSCYALSEVTLPASLKSCESGIFTYDNITKLTFAEGSTTVFDSMCGNMYSLQTVVLPNTITTIGKSAFGFCESLNNIVIPNGVLSIGEDAFWACENLRSVVIPNSVTSIGDSAFGCCYNLANITIPDGVTEIKNGTFWICENLKNIVIPKSVKSIGAHAFGGCKELTDVYYKGTEQEWNSIDIDYVTSGASYYADRNAHLKSAKKHYNYTPPQDSYFMVLSDTYSVDSIRRNETATYKINLLDENSDLLPIDDVTVQNNTTDIVAISTKIVSDTELELTVEPIKDGDASISLFNGDDSAAQYFNFTVYSNTTTYRADQVPVTNEKLKTNFSRGDMTVDNFEYYFDENKGKYIATMDVYNRSGAIGVVSAYTQDGLISEIEQVDPYIPLPGDFGEFLVYLGTGAVSIAKGENWNYRYSGYCQKTSIEIEVPEDGYLTVSCDVTSDNAAFIYNLVSVGVDFVFKTAEVIDVLGTDTDKLAKDTTKTLAKKVSEYFNEDSEWTKSAIKKLAKKLSKNFNMAYLEDISALSLEMLDEMYKNVGEDFSDAVIDVIIDLTKEEIKEFGVMAAAKKLIKDKVIGTAEKTLLKAASIMFDGGSYVNLVNSILGAYRYNVGTGKTMVVFKPNGVDGFLCKDTIKVTSDIITDEVLLNTYIIKDTQKEDAFVRGRVHPYFNRDDGLDDREISIDLNRVVEIHEISLLKNGEVVSDGFTATVEMNLPSYIDRRTCSIYRVEKDGTYTKLETRIEGNKIIFETDHFSEYILTGVIEDLQETTPCDVHVYEEVRYEPSCTEEGSITYTCYCGDTYTETITANGHSVSEWIVDKDSTCSAEGSKHIECTVCEATIKTETIARLPHDYNSVVTEATCEKGGYTTFTCVCGDTYTGDKTPAKGHNYAEGVCKNCGDSKVDNCSCNCHKGGISGLIWKILRFFYKLFGTNKTCGCGVSHY